LICLDSFALIAFLADEGVAAAEVSGMLRSTAAMSAVNLAETYDVLLRRLQQSEVVVQRAVEDLSMRGRLQIIPAAEALGQMAGRLRAQHYQRSDRPLSLGDCFALATCVSMGFELATADAPLAAVARFLGLDVVPLPDSAGTRPG